MLIVGKMKIPSEVRKFLIQICDEHYQLCKNSDSNIGYLWYLYSDGTQKGSYKRFIFYAEINLNKFFNLINDSECETIHKLLESDDYDNFFIAYLALKHMRRERHKLLGANISAPAYDQVKKDYPYAILSHDLFTKMVTK
jgi:hypothetical protein